MREQRRRPFWYLRRGSQVLRAEVDEELRVHLEMRAEELRAGGMPIDQARLEARRQFGDLEATRRYCRRQDQQKETRVQRSFMVADLMQDVRICCRSLRRAPVLTLTIVITVGLGIGATTAMFGAVNAALLRPLPYGDPERLVRVYTDAPPHSFRLSVADYFALDAQQTQFERIAGYMDRAMAFSDGTTAERLRGREVTWTYFALLGIVPAAGRDFTESDSHPGQPPAVIVSDAFWQRHLAGRREAIGQSIRLDGTAYTVAGVLPRRVGPLEHRQDFFVVAQWRTPQRRGPFGIVVIARLRPGSERASAAGELHAINRRVFPLWKASYQDDKATWAMRDLTADIVGDVGTTAAVALAAVGLVWLMASANASQLLLARVTSRRRELAVRAALGASRRRVMRYLLVESAVLALAAAALGLLLAWVGVAALRDLGPRYFPRMEEVALDGAVWWLFAAVTLASGLLFGIVPAVHGGGPAADESLRAVSRSSTANVTVRRLRRLLVAAQFAIAAPLLIVAGLLLSSLHARGRVDLGFDRSNVLTAVLQLPAAQYDSPGRTAAFWDELRRRIEALPAVSAIAFADGRPPADVGNFNNFDLEDAPTRPGQSQPVAPWVAVTPDYFGVLGLPLLKGRLLEERDTRNANVEAVVVDGAWERRFFPDGTAVGKRFREGGCTSCPWTSVVGVVSTVKYAGLDQPDQGTVYWPLGAASRARSLVLRTGGDPVQVLPELRQIVRDLDPRLPLSSVATIDELVAQSLEGSRSLSLLVASFAMVALVLSVVGIYGVMAHYVQQHTRDIGIRLALGGSPGSVLRVIVAQGMAAVMGGVAVGLMTALAMTRLLSNLLFGVGAADALTYLAVSVLLGGGALVACLVPAARAVRRSPAMVLRNE